MGQNNRQRRAAKKRQRATRHHGPSAPWSGPSAPWSPGAADLVTLALGEAARLHQLGLPGEEDFVRSLGALWRESPAEVERAVDTMAARVADALFAGGWTPVDLHEVGRRLLGPPAATYLGDVVAAATAAHPAGRVDPRWKAELEGLGTSVWWDGRRPLLPQWVRKHDIAVPDALAVVVEVLAVGMSLTELAPTLPPPGSASASAGSRPADSAEDGMLAKVRSLLAKAESTDFDDEADALTAKAQELMSRYAIDHAMLARPRDARRAVLRRMWLPAPYVRAKSRLVGAVAEANRCRTVLAEQSGHVTIVGDQGDVRLVVLLATSLLVQASRALAATRSQYTRTGVSRTRSFRQSFLLAYAARIGERLTEADASVRSAADQSKLLPVLAARTRAVDEAVNSFFPHLVEREITIGNAAGWGAGRAAAELALFDVASVLEPAGERTG